MEQQMTTSNSQHYNVVIAGARCAGAATAMLLARQEARVLLLDRSRYGADTLSTHALMRGAVVQLRRWGLLPQVIAAGTPAIRSATFHLRDAVSASSQAPGRIDALYAPRRIVLDPVLVEAARAARTWDSARRSPDLRREPSGRVRGVARRPAGGTWRSAPTWSSAPTAAARRIARCAGAGGPPRPALQRRPLPVCQRHRSRGYHWHYASGVRGRRHSHQRRNNLRVRARHPRRLRRELAAERRRVQRVWRWPRPSSRPGSPAGRGRQPAGVPRHDGVPPPRGGAQGGPSSGTPGISRTRSPRTASPTRCATRSSSRARSPPGTERRRPLPGGTRRDVLAPVPGDRAHRIVRLDRR